ncbi:GNAT family N-acetyltransferase [Myxacorys almedinensis]|uniref:GNAT family N-acetyltransferase n=1 Tax=Myxacorys almedinensis A TaxID=2690445 RepID=A0A8J8CKU1_9CYAN|nr:GNAT family N-acetyltransferase [Myxacorys almedinensis]NDJ17015.1 GNAT family N-acetyltransferase [Myxacorys almedinensis A]
MNVYSREDFVEAFCAAYYPKGNVKPTLFKLGDRVWRLPALDSTRPIVLDSFETSFIDFYEPYRAHLSGEDTIREVKHLPSISQGIVTTTEWFERNLKQTYEASPTILWETFPTWHNFVTHVHQNRSGLFADSRRRHRKLEKQVGTLSFIFDDRRPEILLKGMKLKSAQYQRSQCTDHFAYPQHVHFFQELAKKNLLLVSSLSAGDQLIAVHLGLFAEGRLYFWIPSYDANFSNYSPGRLLLEMLIEESFNQQHTEFDFMIGGESYKWHYATHSRLISELGSRPLSLRASLAARNFKHSVKRSLKSILREEAVV